MRGQRSLGRTVYLHCKVRWPLALPCASAHSRTQAGKGRSATVALCYLVQLHRITADEAQALLLQLRPQVDRDIASRPEVSEYIRTLDFHPPAAESEDDD